MKDYGTITVTIPTAVGSNQDFIHRSRQRWSEGIGQRRPWKEIFDYESIGFPHNLEDAIVRIKMNIAYFRANYAVIVIAIIFVSLLWHPISAIVFLILSAAWMHLYFLREEALVVLDRTMEDWLVLLFLSVLTMVLLFVTDATESILISLAIGVVLVVIHAGIMRNTGNLSVEEEAAGSAPFLARTPPPGSSL